MATNDGADWNFRRTCLSSHAGDDDWTALRDGLPVGRYYLDPNAEGALRWRWICWVTGGASGSCADGLECRDHIIRNAHV